MNHPIEVTFDIVDDELHVIYQGKIIPLSRQVKHFVEMLITMLPWQSGQPVLLLCHIKEDIELLLRRPRPVLEVPLTERELEVAKLSADGLASKEIGDRLNISPKTVDKHRDNIYKKLGINKISDLEPALRKYGLI